MKILFVINGLGTGGAERSLAEMLPVYVEAKISPRIVCFYHRNKGVEQQIQTQGFHVNFVPHKGLAARVWALRRIIRQERPDLVHTTLFEADIVGRLACAGSGVPVLTSLVNDTYGRVRLQDQFVPAWKLEAARKIDGWTSRRLTTHFHAITETTKQAAIRDLRIRSERITVIERGRDQYRLGRLSQERRKRARHALGIGDDQIAIVNVGRQEFQKGHQYLLEAMAQVSTCFPQAILLIAGRIGNASATLSGQSRTLALGERVRFLGHRDDVPEILAAADLFVFPSLYEGLGGALLEAMALELPIVASDLPALREVVEAGKNALLVKSASSEDLAEGMRTLIGNRTLAASFGQRSRQIYEQRFTLEISAERMVALYREVANARN